MNRPKLANHCGFRQYVRRMSTLADIEQAAVKLPAGEQQQLLRFLLRVVPVAEAELPEPRIFSEEEIQGWLSEDEASMRRLRERA